MKRGEIYFIKHTPREGTGSEQSSDRPAVIVSNDKCNEYSDVVEVVYMTTRPKKDLPTHVFTRSSLTPSTILCEQVHSVSKQRLGAWIGTLTESEIQAVNAALLISLGIDLDMKPEPAPLSAEEVRERMKEVQPVPFVEQNTEIIKLETERNIYRQLYNELLDGLRNK